MTEQPAVAKKLHPDSEYIMQDKIGSVIAKGLATVYKEKPNNPVDYFAKWLLMQSEIQKKENQEKLKAQKVQEMKDREVYEQKKIQKAQKEKDLAKEELDNKIKVFKENVSKSDDLNDNL